MSLFRIHSAEMSRRVQSCMLLAIMLLSAIATANEIATAYETVRVVVLKRQHKLLLLSGEKIIRTYAVALGGGGLSPKMRQGDHRTPEGLYQIDYRNSASSFHRALHISYPNEADRERARRLGASPGGNIMIHGITNGLGWVGASHRLSDWTDGCIAVTNAEIEEIWSLVPDGTSVEIRP